MRIVYHPDFPKDIRKFEADYMAISDGLVARFRKDLEDALDAIKASPQSAGHFLQTGSKGVREFRRRNLRAFPFFVLYGRAGGCTDLWLRNSQSVGSTDVADSFLVGTPARKRPSEAGRFALQHGLSPKAWFR